MSNGISLSMSAPFICTLAISTSWPGSSASSAPSPSGPPLSLCKSSSTCPVRNGWSLQRPTRLTAFRLFRHPQLLAIAILLFASPPAELHRQGSRPGVLPGAVQQRPILHCHTSPGLDSDDFNSLHQIPKGAVLPFHSGSIPWILNLSLNCRNTAWRWGKTASTISSS